MNRTSIVDRFWNKRYGACPGNPCSDDDYEGDHDHEDDMEEGMEEEMEYSEEEDSLNMGEEGQEMDLVEDASMMLEEFVETHDGVESAELALVMDWSGGEVTPKDLGDGEGMNHMARVTDERGQSHTLSSSMWNTPRLEEDEYE